MFKTAIQKTYSTKALKIVNKKTFNFAKKKQNNKFMKTALKFSHRGGFHPFRARFYKRRLTITKEHTRQQSALETGTSISLIRVRQTLKREFCTPAGFDFSQTIFLFLCTQ